MAKGEDGEPRRGSKLFYQLQVLFCIAFTLSGLALLIVLYLATRSVAVFVAKYDTYGYVKADNGDWKIIAVLSQSYLVSDFFKNSSYPAPTNLYGETAWVVRFDLEQGITHGDHFYIRLDTVDSLGTVPRAYPLPIRVFFEHKLYIVGFVICALGLVMTLYSVMQLQEIAKELNTSLWGSISKSPKEDAVTDERAMTNQASRSENLRDSRDALIEKVLNSIDQAVIGSNNGVFKQWWNQKRTNTKSRLQQENLGTITEELNSIALIIERTQNLDLLDAKAQIAKLELDLVKQKQENDLLIAQKTREAEAAELEARIAFANYKTAIYSGAETGRTPEMVIKEFATDEELRKLLAESEVKINEIVATGQFEVDQIKAVQGIQGGKVVLDKLKKNVGFKPSDQKGTSETNRGKKG